MKKFKKKLAALLVSTMVASSMWSFSAFAAEAEVDTLAIEEDIVTVIDDGEAMPLVTRAPANPVTLGETNQYTSFPCHFGSKGGYFSVIVHNFEPKKYQMDIIMYGRNGALWQEQECLHEASSRVFECSSEVTSVALRIIPRPGLFPAPKKGFSVGWAVSSK